MGGSKVEAVSVKKEDDELIGTGISELKSRFSKELPVMEHTDSVLGIPVYLLVLCVNDLCLVLQLFEADWRWGSFFSKQLSDFLLDDSICFAGFDVQWSLKRDPYPGLGTAKYVTLKGSDVRMLAAEVYDRISWGKCGMRECGTLAELAGQVGYGESGGAELVKLGSKPWICYKELLLGEELLKNALYSAYCSYRIGAIYTA